MFNIKEYAKALRIGGYPRAKTEATIKVISAANGYVPDLEQALLIVEKVYNATPEHNLTEEVTEYVMSTNGYFTSTGVYKELQVTTRIAKKTCAQALSRLVKAGVIERHKTKNGVYRRIEAESNDIDWRAADISATVPVKWPFDLQDYALMYPKNIAIIAGDSNAGKTAMCLNILRMNMDKFDVYYFSSEMGPEELKLRLSKFKGMTIDDWNFHPKERSSKFADVIQPNALNIIDYIEIGGGEFYLIADELRGIFDKLDKGIAVIALQKKGGATLGRGAEFSLEKPRLYLSMGNDTLKIIKAKNWSVEDSNPNGLEFRYKLVNGCEFIMD